MNIWFAALCLIIINKYEMMGAAAAAKNKYKAKRKKERKYTLQYRRRDISWLMMNRNEKEMKRINAMRIWVWAAYVMTTA